VSEAWTLAIRPRGAQIARRHLTTRSRLNLEPLHTTHFVPRRGYAQPSGGRANRGARAPAAGRGLLSTRQCYSSFVTFILILLHGASEKAGSGGVHRHPPFPPFPPLLRVHAVRSTRPPDGTRHWHSEARARRRGGCTVHRPIRQRRANGRGAENRTRLAAPLPFGPRPPPPNPPRGREQSHHRKCRRGPGLRGIQRQSGVSVPRRAGGGRR
jgi:hypothetical protein